MDYEQEPQQQPEVYMPETPQNISLPNINKDERRDIVTIITKVDQIIEKIENDLRCKERTWNEDQQVYEWTSILHVKPLMNELGIKSIIIFVKAVVNENTICSSFDDEEIRKKVLWMHDKLCDLLFKKYQEFEVDKANLSTIIIIVEDTIKTTLNRAKEGMTLQAIQSIAQIREIQTQTISQNPMMEQRPSWKQRLNPFGLFR